MTTGYNVKYCAEDTYSDELEHHGIKGMKWGVRRYRNPDGTLTEAGKKRYAKAERNIAEERKKVLRNPKKLSEQMYNPDYKFTQEEIDQALRTFKKENEILRVAEERGRLTSDTTKRGKSITKKILDRTGDKAIDLIALSIVMGGAAALNKKFGKKILYVKQGGN